MRTIRRAFARTLALVRGHDRASDALRAEMEAHLDMAIDENIRRGMNPAEARRQALLASGGLTQAAESVHEQRGIPWIESIAADVRYAVRHFRRTPLSTITMVLVLTLGIGTNIVLFTVLNSIMTLPSPGIARDESLVRIRGSMRLQRSAGEHPRVMSWPEVQEYAARTDLFSGVAAHAYETGVVSTGDGPSGEFTADLVYATSNYFSILNIRPSLGSEPSREPDVMRMATSPTAMISYAMWQQTFGARDVIGEVVRINGVPVEIVGVGPPRFLGTGGTGRLTMWLPLAAYPQLQKRTVAAFISSDSMFLIAAARLRPGVTPKMATPVVAGIAQRVFRPGQNAAATSPASEDIMHAQSESGSADVVPMLASNQRVTSGGRSDMLISAAASGGFALLVLLITCTNVSALMVGLAVARRREIGVRLSLGAPRRRLIRQLLTESTLLALIAAAVGLVVTTLGIRAMGALLDDIQLVLDWRVTIATCAVAIITGILFGVSPALHATRVSVADVLKSSTASVGATRAWSQRALVVAQITLTQPLLVGLGVVIATMVMDMGGRATSTAADRIAELELDTWAGNVPIAERAAMIEAAVERVAAMPGVVFAMPMQMGTIGMPLTVHPADRIAGRTYEPMVMRMIAAPRGYFNAFDIPILRGRDFNDSEYAHTTVDPSVPMPIDAIVIGSDLARRLWGDADPLGRRLTLALPDRDDSSPTVVVGIVDEKAAGPSDVNGQTRAYIPYGVLYTGVIARTAGPAAPMLDELRAVAVTEVPQMPIYRLQTMAQREAEFRRDVLRASGAVAGGGLLALMLSAIGLYAVVSFAVGQRAREIGIRTALGAQSGQVVRMFFVRGLALCVFGLILGLPLSMITVRMISTTLNWPLTTSPLLGVAIGGVVLAVASLAVWIPARRASTIDPIVALRSE